MKRSNLKHILAFVTAFFAVTNMGLWSWNALSELFAGPIAQYKHVLAAVILLAILKWTFTGTPRRWSRHQRMVARADADTAMACEER